MGSNGFLTIRRAGNPYAVAPGTTATGDEIGAALESLSRFKHPRHYVFVAEVLRAPNGKADYKWAKQTAAGGGVS